MARLLLITLACCALAPACNTLKPGTGTQLPPFPGQLVAIFNEQHCKEASGIVFSRSRGTLFVVGDEGDICELHTDGILVNKAHIPRTDLEGITSNPLTGNLYALDELSTSILEINPDNLEVLQHISIDLSPEKYNHENKNRGFEAITFLPNPGQAANSRLFIANQGRSDRASAAVHELTVPLADGDNVAKTLHILEQKIADLSGLHYDDSSGLLLVISDAHNTLLLMTVEGDIRTSYTLPGENQEGITLDDESRLYIAEDSGNIIKYTFPAMPGYRTSKNPMRTKRRATGTTN
ncbi:MAG: SdiA-regulated domain-containing protein [Gammaproteobacteria bacterium]|nr:SdiA-regulated domain-containing protein [Gammaproteobacteria bacterium]MDH3972525.1 SdiA-regulated domain-containing protein [Gammaproteobacteria bacterium]